MSRRTLQRAARMWTRRGVAALMCACSLLLATTVCADPVRGVRSAVSDPIAIRGGVLMVRLTAQRPGDNWPERLTLSLSDQRRIQGTVAWVYPLPTPNRRHWTEDSRRLGVRRIEPTDDTSIVEAGTPYLLARLPSAGRGQIRLQGRTLHPHWHDPPQLTGLLSADSADRGTLELIEAADRPDPRSPFEYSRWVLLAHRLGMSPPSPLEYGEVGSMVAQYYADLWRLGLSRFRSISPGTASACRDLLTQTCLDQDQSFAVWVADPTELAGLLSSLLDFTRSDRQVMQSALAWADAKNLRLVWPQSADRDHITVAIANPTFEPAVARLTWPGTDQAPVAIRLEPAVLTRIDVDRPIRPTNEPSRPAPPETLIVEVEGRSIEVTSRRDALIAKPPGIVFAPLRSPLTLAEAQTHQQLGVPSDRSTLVQLRRFNHRWEIFWECRRPTPPTAESDLAAIQTLRDTQGIEAVTLLIGPEETDGGPTVVLIVPELGWRRLLVGENDGTLQVHRRSYDDRWHCRLVMPESWMKGRSPGRVDIGFTRTHSDSDALEAGPNTTVPWQLDPGRVTVDISTWTDVPLEPVRLRGGQAPLNPAGQNRPLREGATPLIRK